MPIPSYVTFIEPILRYLADNQDGVSARDAYEFVASRLKLTDEDRQKILPSGLQPIYKNRAGWAHDRLKRAGYSQSPRRGWWQITERGLRYAQAHPNSLSAEELQSLATDFLSVRLRNDAQDEEVEQSGEAQPSTLLQSSPDERLDQALTEIRRSVSEDLLESLSSVSPGFFEKIVLDLLYSMGYGTSRTDLQRVGGTGDGGIDGIISLDRLGLEKVYVQAKRWQQTVGRPEVQAFYGALAGQRASKGVFITTSNFTFQALEFAKAVEKIVLVDGSRLTDLMIDFGIGVGARTVKVPKLDADYFEEE